MKKLKLALPGETDYLQQIRNFINGHTSHLGFSEQDRAEIEMAVDEAATNIIRHGYQEDPDISPEKRTIELEVLPLDQGIQISLRDHGKNFDPTLQKVPDLEQHIKNRKTSGLGVFAMSSFMDSLEHHYIEGVGNEIIMKKHFSS